jgi:aromatic-L-amino-acid decarboxylase
VIEWIAGLLGMPPGAGGVLTSGGSMANLTAIVTARRERLPADFLRGVLYCSDQVHHSITKAALVAGFAPENVRCLPSDASLRLDPATLERAVAEDLAEGRTPFCVVASAGTTNTGAVDPLGGLAEVAAREGLWLHVDAAYGGFFALTERGRATLAGVELADSVTLDPHKSLFLPYGTGCLVVRDRDALRRAHAVRGAYLPPRLQDEDWVDACDLSVELSREARGLRVWLPIVLHGARTFREALDEKLELARFAADAIAAMPGMSIVAPPELSLFAFRWVGDGSLDEAELERTNRRLLAAINERQRVFLTGTTLPPAQGGSDPRFVLRMCVLSVRTHREHVERALEDVAAAVPEVAR